MPRRRAPPSALRARSGRRPPPARGSSGTAHTSRRSGGRARPQQYGRAVLDGNGMRAEVAGLPVAAIGDDGGLRIGHLVLALGAGPRASAAIVSALDIRAGRHPVAGEILAVDLTLYPGFSGGPLVDVLGRVIGITTSGVSRHLQCAVRAATVTRLAEHVVRGGKIPRA